MVPLADSSFEAHLKEHLVWCTSCHVSSRLASADVYSFVTVPTMHVSLHDDIMQRLPSFALRYASRRTQFNNFHDRPSLACSSVSHRHVFAPSTSTD